LNIYLRASGQFTDMHLNTVNVIPENMASRNVAFRSAPV
jgi:hypothetical protein